MQVPLLKNGVVVLVQVRHWLFAGPLQVPQDASQGSQTLLPLEYLPSAVQDAWQLPICEVAARFRKGEAVVHE